MKIAFNPSIYPSTLAQEAEPTPTKEATAPPKIEEYKPLQSEPVENLFDEKIESTSPPSKKLTTKNNTFDPADAQQPNYLKWIGLATLGALGAVSVIGLGVVVGKYAFSDDKGAKKTDNPTDPTDPKQKITTEDKLSQDTIKELKKIKHEIPLLATNLNAHALSDPSTAKDITNDIITINAKLYQIANILLKDNASLELINKELQSAFDATTIEHYDSGMGDATLHNPLLFNNLLSNDPTFKKMQQECRDSETEWRNTLKHWHRFPFQENADAKYNKYTANLDRLTAYLTTLFPDKDTSIFKDMKQYQIEICHHDRPIFS